MPKESIFDSLVEDVFRFVQEVLQDLDLVTRKLRSAYCNEESKQRDTASYESENV